MRPPAAAAPGDASAAGDAPPSLAAPTTGLLLALLRRAARNSSSVDDGLGAARTFAKPAERPAVGDMRATGTEEAVSPSVAVKDEDDEDDGAAAAANEGVVDTGIGVRAACTAAVVVNIAESAYCIVERTAEVPRCDASVGIALPESGNGGSNEPADVARRSAGSRGEK